MIASVVLAVFLVGGRALAGPDDGVTPHVVRDTQTAVSRVSGNGKATVWQLAGAEEGAKNAFFGVLALAPGAKVPVHRDATEEYIYILSGTGEITIDGQTTAVGPGFGIFMPAGAEVRFEVTGTEGVRAVQFFAGQGPEAKYASWKGPEAERQ